MEVVKTTFVGSYPSLEKMPKGVLPEIAFIGRSNVGKSSLINKLLGSRKKIAKTSSTPGKTRMINLFLVNDRFYFVDLPGYGFAKASKSERNRWQSMIEGYLLGSENLRVLLSLMDARHGALANDRQMLEWLLYQELPFLPVMTKADKLKKNDLAKARKALKDPDNILNGAVFSSTENNMGIKEIWGVIDSSLK